MAGAPRGNKNAIKGLAAKTTSYRLTMTKENKELLDNIAKYEKRSIAQVIEKSLEKTYPDVFSGKFYLD